MSNKKDALLEVTCKTVIFNLDLSKVLMLKYESGDFGIPGGHIEEGEDDFFEVAKREIREEVGLDLDEIHKVSFYIRKKNQRRIDRGNFKLVLGFYAIIPEDSKLHPTVTTPEEAIVGSEWLELNDAVSAAHEARFNELLADAIISAQTARQYKNN